MFSRRVLPRRTSLDDWLLTALLGIDYRATCRFDEHSYFDQLFERDCERYSLPRLRHFDLCYRSHDSSQ